MDKRKLIIDTDCGSDDAVAIAMAMREPSVEVLMFSVVCGNVPMEQAAKNTLTTLEYADTYFPPAYPGCARPLLRDAVYAFETHGADGLGDLGFVPERLSLSEGNGVIEMLKLLRESKPGEIEVVALGPLTNIAVALMLDPDALGRAKRISIMGSAGLGIGNVTPVAEFNIWQDAEAAKMVLESGLPLLFVGWDACLGEAMLDQDEIEAIRNSGRLGRFAMESNRQLMALNEGRFGRPALDMADPAAMAAVLWPECVRTCAEYYCEVDTMPGPSYGAMLVYREGYSGEKPNAFVCSELHPRLYKEYLAKALAG